MDELYEQWSDAVDSGETTEDFEGWFSGKCADAEDMYDE